MSSRRTSHLPLARRRGAHVVKKKLRHLSRRDRCPPASGFTGVFTLNVLTKGMDQPVEVRFEFPPVKEHHGSKDAKTGS